MALLVPPLTPRFSTRRGLRPVRPVPASAVLRPACLGPRRLPVVLPAQYAALPRSLLPVAHRPCHPHVCVLHGLVACLPWPVLYSRSALLVLTRWRPLTALLRLLRAVRRRRARARVISSCRPTSTRTATFAVRSHPFLRRP